VKRVLRWALDGAIWVACGAALLAWPLRLARRALTRRVRSLWTGTPIITMVSNCRAERMLGVDARSLVFHTYYVTDAFDHDLSRWSAVPLLGRLVPLAVFVWACVCCDRIHAYCDRGILPSSKRFVFDFRELRVYRLLGIDVFLWAYGADVRNRETARAMGEPNPCTDCDAPGKYCLCDPVAAADSMRRLAAGSRAIFAGMGEMFGYTPGSIDDLHYWPLDLEADGGERYRPTYPEPRGDRPLRIVHAANHRMFKGTRYLIEAVEQLRAEGEPVELVLVEHVSNAKALELYRSADIIFDQCLLGGFGYFALEGMALGKPVMTFVRHPERYLLRPEECPLLFTHVSTLKQDIRALLHRRGDLPDIGRRGRAYIERHFTLGAFAGRLEAAYRKLGVMH